MIKLSDRTLIESFRKAEGIGLEPGFKKILKDEMKRRGIQSLYIPREYQKRSDNHQNPERIWTNNVLMEGIQDIVFVVKVEDQKFTYEYLNSAAMEFTGLNPSILGKSLHQVLSNDQGDRLTRYYQDVVRTGKSLSYEDSFLDPIDNICYSQTLLTPLFDEENNMVFIVSVSYDVTKEKRFEKALKNTLSELYNHQEQYQSLFYYNSDAILSFDLDGKILDGNLAVHVLTGFSGSEFIGRSIYSIFAEEDMNKVNELILHSHVQNSEDTYLTIIQKSGHERNIILKVTPLLINGEISGMFAILRDMTDLLTSQRKLKEKESELQIITEHVSDLITLLDDKGMIIFASPSYRDVLGYENKEYIGKFFLHNTHLEDRKSLDIGLIQSMKNREPFRTQFRQYNHQNEPIWFELKATPVFDDEDNFQHMVVLSRDIQTQKIYEDKLKHMALHDSLTGLPNRTFFYQQFEVLYQQFIMNNDGFAAMVLDIDYFKSINDTFGHDIGDHVINEFGKRVKLAIREQDMVARMGGDEFSIFLPGIVSRQNAEEVARNILETVEKNFEVAGEKFKITTSIGIAIALNDEKDPFILLKHADIALYEAKTTGRNKFCVKDRN